ncbi:MinD/ParA family protein [Halobacillus salinus]|uniref:MinD/ParA family protein n=1 Tax=Halobacillus salinus TaxID=192814 RepID=A0A4Z0H317_9BACI|nr:MinD/ParA family protein [Halobacillus salinus]TGB04788.1 MinD/ParA family protein [Halobacillus salinus]
MSDQAERLRHRLRQMNSKKKARTIAISSGKGGVGKSNFTINFALKLMEHKKRVLIIDMDIGMGNIDILLGVTPRHSFVDLFKNGSSIQEIIESGPNDLSYIAGGSGLTDVFQLDEAMFLHFQSQFESLIASYDYILFDMGAGATNDSLHFISSADESIVVTTPEPTSITDAYAMIKHLVRVEATLPISILVNRSLKERNDSSFTRLHAVVDRFLEKEVTSLGVMPDDRNVLKAVNRQQPFVLSHPSTKASMAMSAIVQNYLKVERKEQIEEKPSSFLSRLKRFVVERS